MKGHTETLTEAGVTVTLRLPAGFTPTVAYPLQLSTDPPNAAWEKAADRHGGIVATVPDDALPRALPLILARFPVRADAIQAPSSLKGPAPSSNIILRARVTGVRSSRGILLASLFCGTEGFPADPKRALTTTQTVAEVGSVTVDLGNVSPGLYAVALFHDTNENGKLDTSLGIPSEDFGFSNNPKVRFGPPRAAACLFRVTDASPERLLEIQLSRIGL